MRQSENKAGPSGIRSRIEAPGRELPPYSREWGPKRPIIGEKHPNTKITEQEKKWKISQDEIDEMEEFQKNVDSLKIEYRSYIDEKDLRETASGHSLVSINAGVLKRTVKE